MIPAVENLSSGLAADVDNVADSGDESEEEWKYFSVEPSKQASQPFDQLLPSHQPAEAEDPQQQHHVENSNEPIDNFNTESEQCLVTPEPAREHQSPPQQLFLPETEDGEDSNMDSQLNPNAAEFVPVSPTRETCMLPTEEDAIHPQAVPSSIDNLGFDMDAVAPTENVPVYIGGGFEHQPMDFLPQDEMMGDKENLILQPNIPSPAEHILEAASNFSHDLDNLLQHSPNILDFCGTPPIAICEPCAPFTTETVEQVEDSHFEGGQTFEQEMQQTENLEMFNSDLSHPEPVAEAAATLPEINVDTLSEINVDPLPEMNVNTLSEINVDPLPEMNVNTFSENNVDPLPEMNVDPLPEMNIDPLSEKNVEEEPTSQFGVTEPAQEFSPSPEPVAAVPEHIEEPTATFDQSPSPIPEEEKDMLMEKVQTDVLVETPNFSVAQTPAFPVVENIITPDEESAATASPAVEDAPVTRDIQQEEDAFSQQVQDTQYAVSPTPMSPQLAVCPAFPSEVEPQPPASPLEDMPSAPPTESILQPEISPLPSPVRENAFSEDLTTAVTFQEPESVAKIEDLSPDAVTATPPPTPAAPLDELTTENEEKLPSHEDAFSEVIEKLAAQPEEQQPTPSEEQPTSPEEPVQERHIEDVLAVAAVTATAVGAAAAITAVAKSPKPSSPTKTEAPASKKPASPTKEKVASPTKDKPSSPIKKTTAGPASKAAPKPSPAKAPATAKTTSTTAAKPAPARSAPPAAKPAAVSAPKAALAAKKPTTSALASKPRTPTSTTTAAPRTMKPPTSGASSPTKPTAPKPKPPVTAASKAPEAKKPLANGDAAKPAPRRPISATSSTAATTRAAPRPAASSTAKPASTAAAKPTATSAATKSPPKPRPASAAVNGVAKPKVDVATKTTARPASASATARRAAPATKPAISAKQDKETSNKQLSATTRTTTTTKSTTVTKSTTLKSVPAKMPPIKKPASAATKTKVPSKATDPPKPDEPVQVNGNAHEIIPNGNSDVVADIPQQELLIEPSAPCLVDGAAD
ncbi:UNVERIFIED_CONTAM: hypothetical protein B566_EDAN018672 [Ephemera danica]|nr:hypothetical protein B566_EDAN018672 [Ephemera danica]